MTSTQTADNVEDILGGKKGRKGGLVVVEMEVPLTAIATEAGATAQFRDQLSMATLEGMHATLEAGGTLPPTWLVECAITDDDRNQPHVHAMTEKNESEDILYVPGDGWHRIRMHMERWERARAEARRAAEEKGTEPEDVPAPTIKAIVVKGARNPLAVAKELNIRLNITPGTPPTDKEQVRALFDLREMHPEWSFAKLGAVVGRTHTQVRRLIRQREVRQDLESAGTYVPSNLHMEKLHDAPRGTWPELAKVIRIEKWSPDDVEADIKRAKAISEHDWSHLEPKDPDGTPRAQHDWDNTEDAKQIRLAHAANKYHWTDEELVRSAGYLASLHPAGERDREQAREYQSMLRGDMPPSFWMPEREEEPAPASIVSTGGVSGAPTPVVEPAPAVPATVVTEPEAPVTTPSVPTDSVTTIIEPEAEPEAIKELSDEERLLAEVMEQCREDLEHMEHAFERIEGEPRFESHATEHDVARIYRLAHRLTTWADQRQDALSLKIEADKTDAIDAQIAGQKERAEKARQQMAAQS